MSYNLAIIEGRLTKDPEIRKVGADNCVANFTVAVDRDYKNANGDKEVDFLSCMAWGKKAEFIAQYFHKGDGIHLDGRIQVRKYEDKEGNTRTATDINVGNVSFPPSRSNNSGGNQQNSGYGQNNGYGQQNGGFNQSNSGYGQGYNGGFNQTSGQNFNANGGGNFGNQPFQPDFGNDGDLPF